MNTTTTRELTAKEIEDGFEPASQVENYNPNQYDFCWTKDFEAFRPIKLLWWDDASYIAYQCGDFGDEEELLGDPDPEFSTHDHMEFEMIFGDPQEIDSDDTIPF